MSETDSARGQAAADVEEPHLKAPGTPTEEQPERETAGRRGGKSPQGPAENGAPEASTVEATEEESGAVAQEVERLNLELGAARRRIDELARAYKSLDEDREEFKQRLSRERERMIDVEKGKVALALLEAIDELDRCLDASPEDTSPLAQGVRLIRGNLLAKAQAAGIERLDLVGRAFDPNLAEAVDMEITTDPDADHRVVAEVLAGYRLKDRVIRAARVKVARYFKPAEA